MTKTSRIWKISRMKNRKSIAIVIGVVPSIDETHPQPIVMGCVLDALKVFFFLSITIERIVF